MRIGICDDNEIVVGEMRQLIQKFNEENSLPNDIIYFMKPSQLYEYMEKQSIDVLFMDLEFNEMEEDGILWSRKIKKKWPGVLLIILTAYERRYKEGYEVKAFRFMTKPMVEQELFENLKSAMEELSLTETITLMRRGIKHTILIQDIYYLAAQSGGSELWTRNDTYYCDESLLQWEQKLPAEVFFRCHHKYLVNFMCVTRIEPQKLILVNGEQIPVSRRRRKALQIAYMKWDTGHKR